MDEKKRKQKKGKEGGKRKEGKMERKGGKKMKRENVTSCTRHFLEEKNKQKDQTNGPDGAL